jgi:hypothetical protein
MSITDQVQAEAQTTAHNIARYLAENTPDRDQTTQMQMYDEQFERQAEASDDTTRSNIDRFRSSFSG